MKKSICLSGWMCYIGSVAEFSYDVLSGKVIPSDGKLLRQFTINRGINLEGKIYYHTSFDGIFLSKSIAKQSVEKLIAEEYNIISQEEYDKLLLMH